MNTDKSDYDTKPLAAPHEKGSPERALQETIRRLFVFGKSDELMKLLKLAQLSVSREELQAWSQLDDKSWGERFSLEPRSAEGLDLGAKIPPDHDLRNQGDAHHERGSASLSAESISLDHPTFSEKAAILGLQHSAPPRRYKIGEELARGGVGKVLRTRDRQLNRAQVIKLLNQGVEASEKVTLNFIREAQITAQLEHPNIVPVHDLGIRENGEVYFTMKRIKGQTLKEILRQIRLGDREVAQAFPRVRLLEILKSVCQAIAFAHSRGVLHRDLKPSNVMIGPYGEVVVLDWGIAKVFEGPEVKSPIKVKPGEGVQRSAVVGTPSYMSPEQANGKTHRVSTTSDVYSLGAILYEILTYRPPFRGKDTKRILEQVIYEEPISPRDFRPQLHIPISLDEITMKCLQKKSSERYQSADELLDAINDYLLRLDELDRKYRLAQKQYELVSPLIVRFKQTLSERRRAEENVLEAEWTTKTLGEIDERRQLWHLQKEVKLRSIAVKESFRDAERALREVISLYRKHNEARKDLAYLYSVQLEEAESLRDEVDATHYRHLLREYDQEDRYANLLSDSGSIQVRTKPQRISVTASRGVEVDRSIKFIRESQWGVSPLNVRDVQAGPWRIKLSKPGYADAIYPLRVSRSELIEINAQLYPQEHIGEDFAFIPNGSFMMGGDPSCISARQRHQKMLREFAIAKSLVTCSDYLIFLNETCLHDPSLARLYTPRDPLSGQQLWFKDESGFYHLPQPTDLLPWSPQWPIFGISFKNAEAYCQWKSLQTGMRLRLPTEAEWEKAARGLDHRIYPWGDDFEPSFCLIAEGRDGHLHPSEVKKHLKDISPYGVRDMAGLLHEYCDSPFIQGQSDLCVLKGGSYLSQGNAISRASHRLSAAKNRVQIATGFRMVKEL